jgi:hypothetical protein
MFVVLIEAVIEVCLDDHWSNQMCFACQAWEANPGTQNEHANQRALSVVSTVDDG